MRIADVIFTNSVFLLGVIAAAVCTWFVIRSLEK